MARMASVLIPSSTNATGVGAGPSDFVLTLATTANTSVKLGTNQVFVMNATSAVSVSFYSSQGGAVTANVSNHYSVPASQQTTFDMGQANDTVSITATAGGGATVYMKILSVV